MEAMNRIIQKINSNSMTKISLSDKRCEVCNRIMQIKDEREFCFYCEVIAKEDRQLAQEVLAERAEKEKARYIEVFNEKSLVNPKLLKASFDTFNPLSPELGKVKNICKRYSDNFSRNNPVNLYLFGTYGVGKSHLAVSIGKVLAEKKINSVFISVPKLLSKIRSTYNKTSEANESDLIDFLIEVDCLILDDIGAERLTDWSNDRLFEIIDGRAGKHTVYTSNYKIKDLLDRVGGRIYSRIKDDTTFLEVVGDDQR